MGGRRKQRGRSAQRETHPDLEPSGSADPPTQEPVTPPVHELDDSLQLARRLRALAAVRLEKVEAICRRLAAGEYEIDPAQVADRILDMISTRHRSP